MTDFGYPSKSGIGNVISEDLLGLLAVAAGDADIRPEVGFLVQAFKDRGWEP